MQERIQFMNVNWRDFWFLYVAVILLAVALVVPHSIVGYAVTLVFMALTLFSPKNGLMLLLIYFPTRSFLMQVNPSLKIMGDAIIVIAFLRVLIDSRRDLKSIFKLHVFEWAFILFCVVGAVAGLITGVGPGAIVFQLRAFLVTFILFYVVRRLDVKKEDVLKFLWTTFIVAVVLCIHGIVEKISDRSMLMPQFWVDRMLSPNNRSRIYGLINNPNMLAVFLSISFMLTLYLKRLVVRASTKGILNVGMILMLGITILTYSRGTWIGLIIAFIVYMILTRNWKVLVQTVILGVFATAIVYYPVVKVADAYHSQKEMENLPPDQQPEDNENDSEPGDNGEDQSKDKEHSAASDRLNQTFSSETLEQSSQTGRLFIVKKGFEVFKDHPIIGTGFATYGDSAAKSNPSPIYEDYDITVNIYADNQYIVVITETGIIGVVLFAVFLLGMVVYLWKKRHDTVMAAPVLAVLFGILFCGLIYNIWEDKTFTAYFFMMLGAVATGIEMRRKSLL